MKVLLNAKFTLSAIFTLGLSVATVFGYTQKVIHFNGSLNEIVFAMGTFTLGVLLSIGSVTIKIAK